MITEGWTCSVMVGTLNLGFAPYARLLLQPADIDDPALAAIMGELDFGVRRAWPHWEIVPQDSTPTKFWLRVKVESEGGKFWLNLSNVTTGRSVRVAVHGGRIAIKYFPSDSFPTSALYHWVKLKAGGNLELVETEPPVDVVVTTTLAP